MGDVAGSGGYLITTAADKVLADPATITGSIGVFSIFPTADRTMDKLGIHTGGVATAWPAGAVDLRRPIDSRLASVLQSSVGYVYRQFLADVSQARGLSAEQVNEIAQGRVWTGRQARERGLVDDLGGLQDAVRLAASLAKLGDGYRTSYIEAEPKGLSRLLGSLPGTAVRLAAADLGLALPPGSGGRTGAEELRRDLRWLTAPSGTRAAYAHCLCQAP